MVDTVWAVYIAAAGGGARKRCVHTDNVICLSHVSEQLVSQFHITLVYC